MAQLLFPTVRASDLTPRQLEEARIQDNREIRAQRQGLSNQQAGQEPCWHWQAYRCNKGSRCRFSHEGQGGPERRKLGRDNDYVRPIQADNHDILVNEVKKYQRESPENAETWPAFAHSRAQDGVRAPSWLPSVLLRDFLGANTTSAAASSSGQQEFYLQQRYKRRRSDDYQEPSQGGDGSYKDDYYSSSYQRRKQY